MTVLTWLGWAGALIYAAAFASLAVGILRRGRPYFLANLVAAVAVVVSSAALASWQAVAVNLAWALLSLNAAFGRRLPLPGWIPLLVYLLSAALALGAIGLLILQGWLTAVDVLAWFSLLGFVYAYLAFANFQMEPTAFHAWNLCAAVALIPQVLVEANYPVLVIESLWSGIALIGLCRAWRVPGAAA